MKGKRVKRDWPKKVGLPFPRNAILRGIIGWLRADYIDGSCSPAFGRRTVVDANCPPVTVSSPGARRRRPWPCNLHSSEAERHRSTPLSTVATAMLAWSPPSRRAVPTWSKHDQKVSRNFDLRGSAHPTFADFSRYSSPIEARLFQI